VIASSTTAFPEVVGDAGLLVDPDDIDGWAAAMALLLAEPGRRADLAARGRERAARFSWVASADALVSAYHRAFDHIAEGRDHS
jgi:glycosyltransferase involved in cell wall biosynthesis